MKENEVAQEVPVQEQQISKLCPHCNKICTCKITTILKPKYCYYCGIQINYFSSK